MTPNSTENFALAIHALRVDFPAGQDVVRVVDGVSLDVARGEIVGLVGESGSGKSVTARAVLGLLPQTDKRLIGGEIFIDGIELLSVDARALRQLRARSAAMIFQEPAAALNPSMTIGLQMADVLICQGIATKSTAAAISKDLLAKVRIEDGQRVLSSYPFQLSGGMCQRVLVAMAFSGAIPLVLADEPTTALDVGIQAEILSLMRQRAEETGAAILLISHDLAVIGEICSRVYVMYQGRIVEKGSVRDVIAAPAHPYTIALLNGLLEGRSAEPAASTKSVARVAAHTGCAFRLRCPLAGSECETAPPLMPASAASHWSACWRVPRADGPEFRDA